MCGVFDSVSDLCQQCNTTFIMNISTYSEFFCKQSNFFFMLHVFLPLSPSLCLLFFVCVCKWFCWTHAAVQDCKAEEFQARHENWKLWSNNSGQRPDLQFKATPCKAIKSIFSKSLLPFINVFKVQSILQALVMIFILYLMSIRRQQ